MFYINKKTLEVKNYDCKLFMLEVSSDWEHYPYDEYAPEKEYLKFEDNGDTDYGDEIKYVINPAKTIQEITDDLKAIELKHAHHLEKYDYISFEVSEVEDCDLNEEIYIIPVGVYRPTKERALAWYKEKIKVQAINKKNQIESDLRAYERYKKDMNDAVDRLKKNGYEGYMNKPKEPLLRIVREGSLGLCKKCGSSLEYKYDFIFQFGELGCIQPLCDNYYLRNTK